MTAPALDLLLRLAREQLSSEQCARCGSSLADSGLAVREHSAGHVVIAVVCKRCDHVALVSVSPGADEGIARVG